MRQAFTVRGGSCDYVLEVGGAGATDRDAALHLRNLIFTARSDRGGQAERAVLAVFRRIAGASPSEWECGDLAQRYRLYERVSAELDRALSGGRLNVRQETIYVRSNYVAPEEPAAPRGYEETSEFVDVFVLAAEVKLIGDTPLINHDVRIIDPDSGEIVAESTTDAKGIVRADVPKAKTYRIEIVDREFDMHGHVLGDERPSVLRCELVDAAGEPVAHHDVEATTLDGKFLIETDEAGRIEVPMPLGHVQLQVDDDIFDAHAVLASDDSVYRFVLSAPPAEEGPPEHPENRLHRIDDDAELDEVLA